MDALVDHYEVLGVSSTATKADIKKAYHRMADAYHPDKVQMLGKKLQDLANEEMKKINEARRVLTDEGERATFDAALSSSRITAPGSPAPVGGQPMVDRDIKDRILETQSLIWEIKGMGVNVTAAERLFSNAKKAFQSNDMHTALHMLSEAKAEAEASRMYRDSVETLNNAKAAIERLHSLGGDTEEALRLYARAQPAARVNDHVNVIYYAELARKKAESMIDGLIYDLLSSCKDRIRSLHEIGLDTAQVQGIYNMARPALKEKDPRKAVAIGKQVRKMLNDMLMEYSEQRRLEAKAHFNILKMKGEHELARSADTALENALTDIGLGNMEHALETIEELYRKESPGTHTAGEEREVTWSGNELEELKECSEEDVIESDDPLQRRYAIYRRTLEQVWEDEVVTRDESLVLENLREQLGISPEEHARMEGMVKQNMGLQ